MTTADVGAYAGFFGRGIQLSLRGSTDSTDDRRTPLDLFAALDAEFHFTLDAAASAENALCERYHHEGTDGLVESWSPHVVWCNPPYSDLAPWVEKAWEEWRAGATVVMLLPANRTEQPWWQEAIEPYRDGRGPLQTRFLAGRPNFYARTQTVRSGSPFGCVVVVWSAVSP